MRKKVEKGEKEDSIGGSLGEGRTGKRERAKNKRWGTEDEQRGYIRKKTQKRKRRKTGKAERKTEGPEKHNGKRKVRQAGGGGKEGEKGRTKRKMGRKPNRKGRKGNVKA